MRLDLGLNDAFIIIMGVFFMLIYIYLMHHLLGISELHEGKEKDDEDKMELQLDEVRGQMLNGYGKYHCNCANHDSFPCFTVPASLYVHLTWKGRHGHHIS